MRFIKSDAKRATKKFKLEISRQLNQDVIIGFRIYVFADDYRGFLSITQLTDGTIDQ